MLIYHFILMLALPFVMGRAAKHIAGTASAIARHLGVSAFVISFVLLGLATSMPEISVAFFSALEGTPGLSLGNLVGANIVVLTLLCGLVAVITGKFHPGELYRHHTLPSFLAIVGLPALLVFDGELTRTDGLLMIGSYMLFVVHEYANHRHALADVHRDPNLPIRKQLYTVAAAVGVLLTASYFLVHSALFVAASFGAAPLVIGLVLFSLGTNLPEITLVVTQSSKHRDVVGGDLFGSVLLNVPTLGMLALISPFHVAQLEAARISLGFLVVVVICFGIFMRTKRSLERWEGAALIGLYMVYLAFYARYL